MFFEDNLEVTREFQRVQGVQGAVYKTDVKDKNTVPRTSDNLNETPRAEPHAGCCGGWGRKTPGYPIVPKSSTITCLELSQFCHHLMHHLWL